MFNDWLNLHRPCLFATEVVSDKGKIKKVYKHKDDKTPLECLVQLNQAGLVAFKSAASLEDLRVKAKEKTDLQAAQEAQKAKAELASGLLVSAGDAQWQIPVDIRLHRQRTSLSAPAEALWRVIQRIVIK